MISGHRKRFAAIDKIMGRTFGFLTPNSWTFLSVVLTLPVFYYIINGNFIIAAIFLLLASFLDAIDGAVARVKGATKKGAYLDTIADRYVEFAVALGFIFLSLPDFVFPAAFWVLLYLFGSMLTTYAKAAAKEKGLVKSELSGGLMERPERMLLLIAALLLASVSRLYLVYSIIILAVLSNITAIQRIYAALSRN